MNFIDIPYHLSQNYVTISKNIYLSSYPLVTQDTQRDEITKCLQGKVYSWAFVHAKGWIKSKNEHGINHILPFGSYVQKNEMITLIELYIKNHFKNHSFLKWTKIVEQFNYLDKVPFDTVKEVLDTISVKSGEIEIHYSDNIIILKNEE